MNRRGKLLALVGMLALLAYLMPVFSHENVPCDDAGTLRLYDFSKLWHPFGIGYERPAPEMVCPPKRVVA